LSEIPKPVQWIHRVSPEVSEAFLALRRVVQKPSKLDERVKRLCLVAAYAAVGCAECLAGAIREGLRMGLKLEEMLEAASIAVLVSGAQGVMTVHRALELLGMGSG